ncbi:MAG: hypothetical protein NT027_15245 [Proteobacteria bacterium]|nr:hypothetical protein [Pseudomonadota bacterium]
MPQKKPIEQIFTKATSLSSATLLWNYIINTVDCFAQPLSSTLLKQLATVDIRVENSSKPYWELISEGVKPDKYLPIRKFRSQNPISLATPETSETQLVFQSSGTTTSAHLRSKSGFSGQGADFYRLACLKSFEAVLRLTSGHEDFVGISVVPTVNQWPDSSLARMVHWFSEFWPIEYADYLDADSLLNIIKGCHETTKKPVFLFGTAFHFIDMIDQAGLRKIPLPEGSLIFETGGTKGRTRTVHRPELYQMLSSFFVTPIDKIVSEYGMCELSSQAYDFVPLGKTKSLADRTFKFPNWCMPMVMDDPSMASESGIGALTLWDTARIDIGIPIQTEDLVHLNSDGSFQLLGRIETAPLKGCSLKVDEVKGQIEQNEGAQISLAREGINLTAIPSIDLILGFSPEKSAKVLQWLQGLTKNLHLFDALKKELGSPTLAEWAIHDFSCGIPLSNAAMKIAAEKAFEGRTKIESSWMIIPPSSHSFAAIHALAILCCIDVRIKIRRPNIRGATPEQSSSFDIMMNDAQKCGITVDVLPTDWRLTSKTPSNDAILFFGSNETIESISTYCTGTRYGMGNAISISVTTEKDWTHKSEDFTVNLIRDHFALRQRGCMAGRLAIIIGNVDLELIRTFHQDVNLLLDDLDSLSKQDKSGRALEIVRLSQLGGKWIGDSTNKITTVVFQDSPFISEMLPRHELVFVVFNSPNHFGLTSLLHDLNGDLKQISMSQNVVPPKLTSIKTVPLGCLNSPVLDGTHFGKSYFASELSENSN